MVASIGVNRRIAPNGNLVLTADGPTRKHLREMRDDSNTGPKDMEYALAELAGLVWIAPEWVGALTDAPIYADPDNVEHPDDADHPSVGKGPVWWFPGYCLENMTDTLIRRGRVVLTSSDNS